MITYASRLRLDLHNLPSFERTHLIQERVLDLLDLLELVWCKDRLIPERPSTRGQIGGELRRLSIAVEFITLPPVLILDDPTGDLDVMVAAKLMECIVKFADRGHTVITSLPKPSNQVLTQVNNLVLLSNGYSIYAGSRDNVSTFFCKGTLGYLIKPGVETGDFLLDVAEGVERPTNSRKPPSSIAIKGIFEDSAFFINPAVFQESQSIKILPESQVPFYGYVAPSETWRLLQKTGIILERALFVKFREYEVLKKSFGASAFLGLFFGYFLWKLGEMDYALSLVGIPYDNVTEIAACLCLFLVVLFTTQVLNVHLVCQKLEIFRYERSAGCSSTPGFWLAFFLSEIPFTLFFGMIFANTVYFMSHIATGLENYVYFHGIQMIVAVLGLSTTITFAAVIRKEIAVRDLYLFCLFMCTMTAGFLFPQPTMTDSVVKISQINPLMWAYKGLMVWKFAPLPDGEAFLNSYNFEDFDKSRTAPILFNFIIFDACILFLALLSPPNVLTRHTPPAEPRESDDDQELSSKSKSRSDLVQPAVFTRESSVTGKTLLSQASSTGVREEGDVRGPTVYFDKVSLRVADRRSPFGYKRVLHKVSGRFDWGKLSVIMGAEGAGKSALLHVLAGQHMGTSSTLGGQVFYNDSVIDTALQPWKRCAFVEAVDEHFRDLSVLEVLTYANELRCVTRADLRSVKINVDRTLELLQLTE
jgi:ABC-type multidrug transport system ATPase subunit